MPGEKHKTTRSEVSIEERSQNEKSARKPKKQKSGREKKRKREQESDELKEVEESPAQRSGVVGDVIDLENAEKRNNAADDDAERIRLEDVNGPSLSVAEETHKKKKKKKKKGRKADALDVHTPEEKQPTLKPDSAETIAENDLAAVAKPLKDSESAEPGKERRKKKKTRKRANHSDEGDGEKQTVVDNEVANAKKDPQSEDVAENQDGRGGEPQTKEEKLRKNLADDADAAKPKQNEISLGNVSKQNGKKRKRREQGSNHADQHHTKDSDREPQEAKQEQSGTKRVKRGRSAAASLVNARDTKSKPLPGDETLLLKSTKQQPNDETPSGASAKEAPQEPSGDQEDAETPLDDKRLPRTLFVGNVPHTADRKEIRKMFAKFGPIESIRIRNVIPDNPKIPKKAALLAKRLASFSNSFSAYVVFKQVPDMDKVLQSAVNGTNMTIFQDHHLRVTKALQTKGKRRLSVFIGNLPFDCSDEELIETFMPIANECGVNLLNVRVTRDSDTGVGRGVGFATFDDMMGIQACMNKAGEITLRGRVLRIERAFKSKMMKSKTYKRKRQAALRRKG